MCPPRMVIIPKQIKIIEIGKDISFKIKQGENIGVIGKTGCGKTTLVDLLLRLYNVNDNSIFIDDIDINKIPIKTIRKYSSYVPQDQVIQKKRNEIYILGEHYENSF